jgi:integrase
MKRSIDEPTFDKTRNRWRVVVPAGMSATGKRIRCWHKTRDAARSYVAAITAATSPAATIPPRLAAEADEARLLLEPFGRSLPEAVREFAAVLRTLGNTGTPLDAAKAWRSTHDQRSASKRFWDAAEAFLVTREGLRADTLRGYRDHLKNGMAALHDVTLSDVTAEAINKALADRPPAMRKAIQTTCGTFIRWAATPPRQWCNAGILEGIDPVRITLDHDITVLTAAEARAVLCASESVSHPTAAAFALALFGGIRLRELGKLTWAAVSADHIEIGSSVAKRHARRLVPVCPTLSAWLAAHRDGAADTDSIVGKNWIHNYPMARRRAGWSVKTIQRYDGPEPSRGGWPKNILRHTCASMLVAIGRPLDELVFGFGHSGGTQMLKRHYAGRLTRKDALAILAIGPGGSAVKLMATA